MSPFIGAINATANEVILDCCYHLHGLSFCRIDKRGKYRRKRANAADADVDYINDKNMRFNKKVARFYDKYTTEIKQNLERGTAI